MNDSEAGRQPHCGWGLLGSVGNLDQSNTNRACPDRQNQSQHYEEGPGSRGVVIAAGAKSLGAGPALGPITARLSGRFIVGGAAQAGGATRTNHTRTGRDQTAPRDQSARKGRGQAHRGQQVLQGPAEPHRAAEAQLQILRAEPRRVSGQAPRPRRPRGCCPGRGGSRGPLGTHPARMRFCTARVQESNLGVQAPHAPSALPVRCLKARGPRVSELSWCVGPLESFPRGPLPHPCPRCSCPGRRRSARTCAQARAAAWSTGPFPPSAPLPRALPRTRSPWGPPGKPRGGCTRLPQGAAPRPGQIRPRQA